MQRHQRPTRDRISYNATVRFAGRSTGGLISLVVLRLAAHYFEPAGWGPIVEALAFVALFSTVADLGVGSLVSRDLARPGAPSGPLLGGALTGALASSVVLSALAAAIGAFAFRGRPNVFVLVAVMLPTIPLSALFSVASGVLVARGRNDVRAVFDVTSSLLPLSGVTALVAEHAGALAFGVVQSGADLLMAAAGLGVVVPACRPGIGSGARRGREVLRRSASLGLYQAIGVAYDQLDTLLVAGFLSVTSVARFGLASQVVAFFGAIPGMVTFAVIPTFMGKDEEGRRELVQRLAEVLTGGGILLLLLGVFFSREVLLVVGGHRYVGAAVATSLLFAATAVSFLTAVFVSTAYLLDLPGVFLRSSFLILGSNIALNLVAIPLWGINGAGGAALSCQLLGVAYSARALHGATRLTPRAAPLARLAVLGSAVAALWLLVDRLFGFAATGPWTTLEGLAVASVYLAGAVLLGRARPRGLGEGAAARSRVA